MSIIPSVIDARTFLEIYKEFKITNYSILLIDNKSMQEFGRCFVKLSSEVVKTELENFTSKQDLNLWFAEKTRWFGREPLFLTVEDLNRIGFTIKLQGLNGHKYDPETRTFK